MWPLKTAEPDQARFQNRLMIRLESHHKTDNDTFTPSPPLRGGGAPPRPGTWPPQLVTPGNCWSQIVGQSDQITEKAHFYTFIILNQVLGAVGICWSQMVTAGHTW